MPFLQALYIDALIEDEQIKSIQVILASFESDKLFFPSYV